MEDKKNVLFLRVDESIQQQALGDFLSSESGRLGKVFNISSEDVADSGRLSEVQYTYLYSYPLHQMGIKGKSPEPIGKDLLDALIEDEPIILKMIERAHFKEHRFRYHDLRTHLYYSHLSYWLHFLKKNEIRHVVFGNAPHDGYDYIIYALAKHLGLQIDMFYQLQVQESYVHAERVEDLFTPIRQALSVLGDVGYDDLSVRMQKEYDVRTKETDPHYMKRKVKYGRFVDPVLDFMRNKVFRTERRRMIHQEVIEPADRYSKEASLDCPFIYFGLHVQPELTTNALGGRFVNQYLAIQLISRCLPDGIRLYVKEHPNMYKTRDPSGRFREFYEMVDDLDNVTLVPAKLNTFELIEKSIAVATITGTLGWEAVFKGKPVLVFGNAFYNFCPGILPVQTPDDMKHAIDRIQNWKVTEEKGRHEGMRYLKAIEHASIEGLINNAYIPVALEKDETVHAENFERVLNRIIFAS